VTPYIGVADAKEYFLSRVGSEAWDYASDGDRLKALNNATKIIDRLKYLGQKADSTQDHEFPRYDPLTTFPEVPQDILDATCEMALALLDGVDPQLEFDNLSQIASNYANIKSNFDRTVLPEHIQAGVPSVVGYQLIKPYLADINGTVLRRVS